MSNVLLTEGNVGRVGLDRLRDDRKAVMERWESLGLLEGLNGYKKENIAQLFENEASMLMNEATSLGAEGSFETVVFPIVRRVFSKLLANEIVSVQALNLPIGKLFFFIPKIAKSTGFQTADAGVTKDPTYNDLNLYDSFYGEDGLFDESKGKYTEVSGATTSTDFTYVASGFTAGATTAITSGASAIVKVTFTLTDFDLNNWEHMEDFVSSMTVKSSAGTTLDWHLSVQKYGDSIMNGNGEVFIVVEAPANEAVTIADIDVTARNYADLELEDEMGEVSFELKDVTVSVIERKLRAQWSPELAQDVSAFHNIDAEAELTALLSEQIAAEIDREILRDLRRSAAWKLRWDYTGSATADNNIGVRVDNGGFYNQKEWNQTLMTAINQISAQIHKSTLRGGANWIVCSAEVSAILDDLEHFHVSNAAPEEDQYNMGIERVGSLSGRYTVYRDPYFPADTILLGHKGTSILDTGYIYAPYVPMQLTPTMYNPFTFAPVKGIMTRYAKKLVNNRYYGIIKVKNLVKFNINTLR